MQPDARNGIETVLHVYPTLQANLATIYHPTHGAIVAIPAISNWANPMQFLCSAHVQSGSRLGYQDSASCARSTSHRSWTPPNSTSRRSG